MTPGSGNRAVHTVIANSCCMASSKLRNNLSGVVLMSMAETPPAQSERAHRDHADLTKDGRFPHQRQADERLVVAKKPPPGESRQHDKVPVHLDPEMDKLARVVARDIERNAERPQNRQMKLDGLLRDGSDAVGPKASPPIRPSSHRTRSAWTPCHDAAIRVTAKRRPSHKPT